MGCGFSFLVVVQVRVTKGLEVQEHDEVLCVEPHEVIRLLKLAGAHRTRLPSPPHTYASRPFSRPFSYTFSLS